jgi:hypothetical protein
MVGLLLAFGVGADLAVGAVLAYRAVAIWLPAPFGLLALGRLRRTVAGWRAEVDGGVVMLAGHRSAAAGRPA